MKISFFLFLFFPIFLFSQTFCLKDFANKSIIPYTHIKFNDAIGGTYSDDNGCFTVDTLCLVQISHINYYDTSLILDPAFPTVYLKNKGYSLEEVTIFLKNKETEKWPKRKRKGFNYYIGIPSYEMGTIVTNYSSNAYLIDKVSIPIKLGKDTPILKINIYELDSARYPNKIIDSQVLDISNIKRNKLSVDFYPKSIKLVENQSIFISIELIEYKENTFVVYENHKNDLRIKIRKRQDKMGNCFVRMKHNNLTWYSLSFLSSNLHAGYEPYIDVDFIKVLEN